MTGALVTCPFSQADPIGDDSTHRFWFPGAQRIVASLYRTGPYCYRSCDSMWAGLTTMSDNKDKNRPYQEILASMKRGMAEPRPADSAAIEADRMETATIEEVRKT